MPSILDIVRGSKSQPTAANVGTADAAPAIQSLLAAKSGLAAPVGGGPVRSNLTEQATAGQTASMLQANEVANAPADMAMQVQEAAGNAAAADQQQNAQLRLSHIRSESDRRMQALADDFKAGVAKLDEDKRDAAADQIARNLRLHSDQYITNLTDQGERQRLGDAASFRIAAQEAQFGADKDLLEQRIGYADWLGMDQDTKKRALAELDLDWALKAAAADAAQANTAAMYGAAVSAVSAGAQGYTKYEEGAFDEDYQASKPDSYAAYKKGKANGG